MDDPPLDRPLALLLAMTRQSPLPYVRGPAHAPVLRPVGSSAQGPHPRAPSAARPAVTSTARNRATANPPPPTASLPGSTPATAYSP